MRPPHCHRSIADRPFGPVDPPYQRCPRDRVSPAGDGATISHRLILECVVAQRLARKLCRHCAKQVHLTPSTMTTADREFFGKRWSMYSNRWGVAAASIPATVVGSVYRSAPITKSCDA